MENPTQQKITKLVEMYTTTFFKEYNQFVKEVQWKKDAQENEYSEVEGIDSLDRALFEIPATLYMIFKKKLEDHEFKYLFPPPNSQPSDSANFNEGPRWFAKKFDEFRLADKI